MRPSNSHSVSRQQSGSHAGHTAAFTGNHVLLTSPFALFLLSHACDCVRGAVTHKHTLLQTRHHLCRRTGKHKATSCGSVGRLMCAVRVRSQGTVPGSNKKTSGRRPVQLVLSSCSPFPSREQLKKRL